MDRNDEVYWQQFIKRLLGFEVEPSELKEMLYILPSYLDTPQEARLNGSSEDLHSPYFFIPHALEPKRNSFREEPFTIKEIDEARQKLGFFINQVFATHLGLKNCRLAIKFAKLDPETGKTLEDPITVTGIIPSGIELPEKDNIRQVEGRNLSADLAKLLKEKNIEWKIGLRPEQESPGIEEIR